MQEKIKKIVMAAIEEMNDDMEAGEKISYASDSILFGKGAGVDSFSFVNLISNIEDQIYEVFDKEVYLVTPSVYEKDYNPFETIGDLEKYIEEVITVE